MNYSIHNCEPTIAMGSNAEPSKLMTGDGVFIDDVKPIKHSHNNTVSYRSTSESIDGKVVFEKKNLSDNKEEDNNIGGKQGLSSMDKICRKHTCSNIDTCAAIVVLLAKSNKQADINFAEEKLSNAYKRKSSS